jgi:hypothetical protein
MLASNNGIGCLKVFDWTQLGQCQMFKSIPGLKPAPMA